MSDHSVAVMISLPLLILAVLALCDNVALQVIEQAVAESSAAKLVEEYVVAADFDNRPVAQLPGTNNSTSTEVTPEETIKLDDDASRVVGGVKEEVGMTEALFPPTPPSTYDYPMQFSPPVYDQHHHFDEEGYVDRGTALAAGPPALAVSQRSVLAVGFITFLILLSSLQNGMMNMLAATRTASQPSLIGGLTQSLVGRRRRAIRSKL